MKGRLLLALVAACATLVAALTPPARAAATYAFATCTDFSGSGCAYWVRLDPPRLSHPCVEDLSADPVARWAFGRVYVVNRFGADNIQVLDPSNNFATLKQFSVGNGTNPQDIVVLTPSKAYVTLYNASYLLVVNPQTGAALDSIPLGPFADPDGKPEAAKMLLYGDRVFVALQRLQNFAPTDYSLLAVVDATADTVLDTNPSLPGVQGIRLTGRNPSTDLAFDPTTNRLLIGEVGNYGVSDDGGVDRIDPLAFTALGFETDEAKLGGEVADVALGRFGAYVIRFDFAFDGNAALIHYDRATGQPIRSLFSSVGANLSDIEINDRDEVWACDRTFAAPGLRVYDTHADTALTGLVSTGLPPFDVLFDAAEVTSVTAPPSAALGLRVVSLSPNPTRGGLEIGFEVGEGPVLATQLLLFDSRGALVDRVDAGIRGPGAHHALWKAGPSLLPGVYYFQLVRGGQSASGRFVLVR